jgi:hypothetical protein
MKNYKNYLTVEPYRTTGTRVTRVTPTKYGFRAQMFNNYVTLYYLKIIVNADKSAKIQWRVERNYSPVERFTTYYNTEGNEITRKEYQQLIKTLCLD